MPTENKLRLTLWIPGILGLPEFWQVQGVAQNLRLKALEQAMARSDPQPWLAASLGYDRQLFALFDQALPAGQDVPAAALRREFQAHDAGQRWWLCADPVHLHADRDRLVMFDPRTLTITAEEAAQLIGELNTLFAEQGLHFSAITPQAWYLDCHDAPGIQTTALRNTIGMDLHDHLPVGPEARLWRKRLTEIQMLLHHSPVNQARVRQGLPTINSVWLWGGGRRGDVSVAPWSCVWSNDILALALAEGCRIPHGPVPPTFLEWLEAAPLSGNHFVVLDGALETGQWRDLEAWAAFIQAVNDEWIMPLLSALRERRVSVCEIVPGQGQKFILNDRGVRRWWRRARRLAAYDSIDHL